MDNDFYERSSTRNKKREQKKQNVMTKVIVVQLVLSLVVSGIMFAVCKTDSNLSKNIKSFYTEISKTDIAVSTILGVFKNVAKQTFAPTIIEETASGETTEDSGEKADFSPVFLTVNIAKPIEKGYISSHFGYRVSPITKEYSLHKGIDIPANANSKIYAVYDGVVEKAEYNSINGNYIIIKHSDSLKTTYNHCNKLLVQKGDKVKKGECIALVGETGYATGNHLHFELIINDKYVNPTWVLDYGV
ncbi:MAG: M23 family metallopeptidase [Clostridia bacterium]|nr:M23 family metallopeptidase [Clostridia bacterium]